MRISSKAGCAQQSPAATIRMVPGFMGCFITHRRLPGVDHPHELLCGRESRAEALEEAEINAAKRTPQRRSSGARADRVPHYAITRFRSTAGPASIQQTTV